MTFSPTDTPLTFDRHGGASLAARLSRGWLVLAMGLMVVMAGLLGGCGGGGGSTVVELPAAVAPELIISSNVAGTASGPVTLRFKFSADVAAFPSGSLPFAMAGAKLVANSFVKVSASEFTTVIQPNVNNAGTIDIVVPAGAFSDSTGRASNTKSYPFTQAYNTLVPDTEPRVDISGSASTPSGQFTITLNFNIDVGSSFTLDKLSLSVLGSSDPLAKATGSALTKVSPTVYTALITPTASASGLVLVSLPKGAVTGLVSGVPNSRDWQYGFFYVKLP
jgi:hypothetical protein